MCTQIFHKRGANTARVAQTLHSEPQIVVPEEKSTPATPPSVPNVMVHWAVFEHQQTKHSLIFKYLNLFAYNIK